MWLARFLKQRWAAHNQRLLDDQLYEAKLAADPIGGPSHSSTSGSDRIPDGSGSIIASAAESTPGFGQGGGAGGPTGPAR